MKNIHSHDHLANFSVEVVVEIIITAAPTTTVTYADQIILVLVNIKTKGTIQDFVDSEDH